jgi:hypothetical protein
MSAPWLLLSPLTTKKMLALQHECEAVIEEYRAAHPDCEDVCGEIAVGGDVPTAEEVSAAHKDRDLPLPDPVLKRLARCRTSLTIVEPGDVEVDLLQLSVLRFLLERLGKGLVRLADYPLEISDEALERLRQERGARGFDGEDDEEAEGELGVEPRGPGQQAMSGLARANRILAVFKATDRNVDLAIDVRRAFGRISELSRRYAMLIYEEGGLPDAQAAQALGVSADDLEAAAASLDQALRYIRES